MVSFLRINGNREFVGVDNLVVVVLPNMTNEGLQPEDSAACDYIVILLGCTIAKYSIMWYRCYALWFWENIFFLDQFLSIIKQFLMMHASFTDRLQGARSFVKAEKYIEHSWIVHVVTFSGRCAVILKKSLLSTSGIMQKFWLFLSSS